jgi:hypothetical protein
MPPKQSKKQITDTEKPATNTDKPVSDNEQVNSIKKEWSDNVQEILKAREKMVLLEKRNDEIITKLWSVMQKNPSEQVIVEADNKEEEKKSSKSKKLDKTDNDIEEAEVKPVAKNTKPKTIKKPEVKPDVESDEEKPAPIKKSAAKTKDVKETKNTKEIKDNKETKKPATPITKGKISAPSKGTPKPKLVDSDDEKPKPSINDDSSSDTEVDSLSSVSSESEASGGEDD